MPLPVGWSVSAGPTPVPFCAEESVRCEIGKPPLEEAAESEAESRTAILRVRTERLLRRYLYTSMQVGRSPSLLNDPAFRGRASYRPAHTFEDAVIFVLDVETCLNRLMFLDRDILCRVVLQEYTHAEAASLLGMSDRTMGYKYRQALDRLTELLLEGRLLVSSR